MPVKIFEHEGKKYAELSEEGHPVYEVDGKDIAYDGESIAKTLEETRGEAGNRRHEVKELKEKLEKYTGIEDPDAAIKAMETVKNYEDKKLVDAGEVETVKKNAIETVEKKYQDLIEQKYKPMIGQAEKLEKQLHEEKIGGLFSRSEFIKEKLTVPVDMVRATYGDHFKIEEGNIVMRSASGNEIYSKTNPGEKATFDEALEIIIENSNHADHIMKGSNKSGSGAGGNQGGTGGLGDKEISRRDFDKMIKENPTRANKLITEDNYKVVD